jgi:glycosyltransferase involved in cell wall biosynthesis
MNPYAYMARAAVFALSSRWEGLPTVLIEALCCGTRVVATDCPSGPREILRGGAHGRLVPVGDVAALACAVETTLADGTPGPASESWRPYELQSVASQYTRLLLGE